jgi:hypothetical protein
MVKSITPTFAKEGFDVFNDNYEAEGVKVIKKLAELKDIF